MLNEDGPIVDSVSSYLSCVRNITEAWNKTISSNNEIAEQDKPTMKFFFRGHGDAEWKLRPSLFRPLPNANLGLYKHSPADYSYYKQEQYIIQEAIRLFPDTFANVGTDIGRMAICQHYALPTRLLDVTGNALVALYFAVIDEPKKAGRVYVFRANGEGYKIASTAGYIDKVSISRYRNGGGAIHKRPLFVFPPHGTARQRVQDGSFFLFENTCKPFHINEFKEDDYRTIEISANEKPKLMAELEFSCGIHKGTLFPETLDGYADKLKREAQKRIEAEIGQ